MPVRAPSNRMWLVVPSLIALVAGCSAGEAAAPPAVPKVTVQHPESRELVDYDEYNGWTDPSATVEIRSRVRGHIAKVRFTDGQMIEAGDLLFELDPRPFQSEVDRAVEQLNIAKAQGEAATKDEARTRLLYERKASTIADVEKVEAVRKTWDAQIISAEENVRRQQLEFSYSKIDAPISGKIGRALMTEGNLVNAGGSDPILTTIVATDPIQIYFSVDERALLKYRERRRAEGNNLKPVEAAEIPFDFGLETDTGFPNRGTIDFADNRIDPTTGTIQVRGKAPNPDGTFVAGGRVRVRIAVGAAYQAVLVPETAVLADQDKKYLLCLNKDNVVVRRDVQLGRLLDDGMRVVLPNQKSDESITPKDWVIVLGLQRARVNYPVEPVNTNSNAVAVVHP